MKKLFASILLLVYFAVSTGFVVSVHYCMNKVDSVQLGNSNSEKCGKCGMYVEDSDGCCKNDVKVVKMQIDQAFSQVNLADFSPYFPVQLFSESTLFQIHHTPEESYPLANGPPLSKQDTYLQNCVFRL